MVDKDTRALEKAKKAEEYKSNLASLMLTTGIGFDGYVVTEYIDVICEEVVFKNGLGKRFGAGIEDMIAGLSFHDAELTGTTGLIGDARKHTLYKFKQAAARIGANAVLGIDFETSFGADIVRVAVSGTAVKIMKNDTHENVPPNMRI